MTDFEKVGMNKTYTFTNITLLHTGKYYVTVKAINNAALFTLVTSEEINIDLTPPQLVSSDRIFSSDLEVICNVSSDETCTKPASEAIKEERRVEISCVGDLIEAKWLEHEDKESGIMKVEWCIETFYDMCNIHRWETIDVNLLKQSAIVHSLPTLMAVRVVVRITNGVENFVALKSSPCNPRKSFPPEIAVKEVSGLNDTEADVDYQTSIDAILISWSFTNDATVYPRVQVALTSPSLDSVDSLLQLWRGEPFVFEFVDVPAGKTYATFSGERIKSYTQYHAILRIWNEFGLYTDSVSDGVVIFPDAPPKIQLNSTDTFLGTENERWQKYVEIPKFTRGQIEDTFYLADPYSVVVDANLADTDVNKTELKSQNIQIVYKASVYRVTSGANETENVTAIDRVIFEQSHIHDEFDVCCSKNNKLPRTIHPDKQFKPVKETTLFGTSVDALVNDLVVTSSKDSVYIFSIRSSNDMSIILKSFNSSRNESLAGVKAEQDKVLVSGDGSVLLYQINVEDPLKTAPQLFITNCKYTMKDKGEHCYADDAWSSADTVGKAFAYDGSDVIVVSGSHPKNSSDLLAVFQNQTVWKLHQILGSDKNDSTFGRAIAVNKNFLVLGGNYSGLVVYSKGRDDLWNEETNLSDELSKFVSNPTNIHLTDENELFVVSAKYRALAVIDLSVSPVRASLKCKHFFSNKLQLSGSLDVMEGKSSVAGVGVMANGRDGAELIMYSPGDGCVRIGGVMTEAGLRFDDGQPRASIALAEDHVIIGTPGVNTWPTNHVEAGTGRVYSATFCQRNFVRRKVYDFGQEEEVFECVPCGTGEEAYPGFEERCVNCSRSICVENSASLSFKVSHCERYLCRVENNRSISQNTSQDNLTVSEVTPAFREDNFYLPGSEHSYFVRVSQLSAAGVETISDSFPFSIDNTSPEAGYVYDGIGSDESRNCSANTTFSSEHQCSSRSFADTDIDFTNNTAEISARWIDFRDNESDIEHYFWCIGSGPLTDDILKCENTTEFPNRTLSGLSLKHNDKYYVTVLACNYAGLCTAKSSDGVLIDTTPPVIDYVRDGLIGPDIDFQVSRFINSDFRYLSKR